MTRPSPHHSPARLHRIAERAYFMAQNGQGGSDEDRWFAAEYIERTISANKSLLERLEGLGRDRHKHHHHD